MTGYGQKFKLFSPNKSNLIEIEISDKITYNLIVNKKKILNQSFLKMTLETGNVLGENLKLITTKKNSVKNKIKPDIAVKSNEITEEYNELIFAFKNNYEIHFRAYNEGIAYRFKTFYKENIIIKNEEAIFNFTHESHLYFPREKEFFSHNERLYEYVKLDTLEKRDLASLPTLIESNSNTKLLITESSLLDYPGMWITGDQGNSLSATFPLVVKETEIIDFERWKDDRSAKPIKWNDYIAYTKGNRTFPWRIIAIAQNDGELVTNQLTYLLAEPCKIKNTEWIKPGKVSWDWWNDNNIYGVDFKSGINTETYKYYIDFAAKYGLEYILLDEGWYELGDVLKTSSTIDIHELISYAKVKNVEIILWVSWSSLNQKLIPALETYKKWGIKGIKVDFMQRDDQWMVNYYEKVAFECFKRELLVDFHGSYKPSGLMRTFPNVLTSEGVKGNENNKWASYITPSHNLTLPFIRMVAGPMDFTPGAMKNTQKEDFSISWKSPMSIGTRCHQIAMYIVFESPLQMLCDSPSIYLKENETTTFIAKIPTIWEETKVIKAKIREYIILARKNKKNWYLGAMTNEEKRDFTIDFSFLENGQYEIEIFQDGINADKNAIDYIHYYKEINPNDQITISLAPGGGWSAIISPKK